MYLSAEKLKSGALLAPMAGVADRSMRELCMEFGAIGCIGEMASSKGISMNDRKSSELLSLSDAERPAGVQIFGDVPEIMAKAIETCMKYSPDFIDINMGCPVPKVYKNGEGSALLNDIKRAGEIVKECVKSGKIITVKIRTGIVRGDDVAAEFAKMAEDCGASLVTVHGRVREAYYSGEPDYEAIRRAKNSVGIPVIANGGIFTEKDADEAIERTGADGVMLARGAIADPFLVAKLTGTPYDITLKDFVIAQLSEMLNRYGDKRATAEFRKFVPYYIKGGENAKAERVALMKCESVKETASLIERFL